MIKLVKFYLELTNEDKKYCLSDIKIKLTNGKFRRIGNKASENVYKYLLNDIDK